MRMWEMYGEGIRMDKVKKIALITSTSNFERYKNIVRTIDERLKEIGGYALYVISCYGLFFDEETPYNKGEGSIYTLLKNAEFDGYILEGNLGPTPKMSEIIGILREKRMPTVALSIGMGDIPFFIMDSYNTGRELVKHMVEVHGCRKINMVYTNGEEAFEQQAVRAYRDILNESGIPLEEKREVTMNISLPNGRELVDIFKERGIDDADATICIHDVLALGLYLEMRDRGLAVPRDMRICSLNRSINSVVFRPDISGADRADVRLAIKACDSLLKLMAGEEIPQKNYTTGRIFYGESCGCPKETQLPREHIYQELILSKVEAGNQISQMMQFNDAMEEVDSLDALYESIHKMINGITCEEFIFCLNSQTLKYLKNEIDEIHFENDSYFEDTMIAVTGYTKRTGEIKNCPYDVKELFPMEARDGDLLLFLPVHHKEQVYGYIVFVNETIPIDVYNYRICHESFGSNIENLHRQMVLKRSIQELDELHMRDEMTGIYNRFAWNRFSKKYTEKESYCVVMLDMDGLKNVNDNFGHLAGNHAINITANAIKTAIQEEDLFIRYGGDEFQIISFNTSPEYWDKIHRIVNDKLEADVLRQKLPYTLGISMGYCICDSSKNSFEECLKIADERMYANKYARKRQSI